MSARDRVIVALDVDTESQARAIVESLGDAASFYKIGLQLLTAAGPALMRELVASAKQVFLDLKLFEIPNSVAGAVRAAGAQGVTMITVHASAEAAGCHGVVASPHEVTMLRTVLGRHMLIVTPGIQRVGEGATDQARCDAFARDRGRRHAHRDRPLDHAGGGCACGVRRCLCRRRAGLSSMRLAARPYLQSVSIKPDTQLDFDTHPHNVPAVRELGQIDFHPDVTFFVGENGSGKSTVLEGIALALGFGPEGGTRNVQLLKTVDSVSSLHESLRLARSFKKPADGYFLRAESFFNVATYMDALPDNPDAPLHPRSHGEAFMQLLTSKFRGRGLYLLDEPEAALSPNRQLAALSAIYQLVKDESQFIIATHSPILLAYPNAKILLFDGSRITEVAYEDTEHFAVTRDFLNHYSRRIEQLLADDA